MFTKTWTWGRNSQSMSPGLKYAGLLQGKILQGKTDLPRSIKKYQELVVFS